VQILKKSKPCGRRVVERRNMNKYIIRIVPEYKDTLKQYGEVIFESQLINSLIGLESELSIDEIWNIPHVFNVEKDREGTFN
jgi:hypothetical protein